MTRTAIPDWQIDKELAEMESDRDRLLKKDVAEYTASDLARAEEITKRTNELQDSRKRRLATEAAFKAAGLGRESHAEPAPGSPEADSDDGGFGRSTNALGKTASGVFAGFTKAFGKAIKNADATVGGVSKALVPTGAITIDYNAPIVIEPTPTFWISAACATVTVDVASGVYLRQNVRQNNAGSVPLGGDKPTSIYGIEPANWKIATLAHLSEPIARQWLADFANLLPMLSGQLGHGIAEALDDFILNGAIVEDGTTVTGLLNDPAVLTTAYAVDMLVTVRRAIGELQLAGVQPTAIALHPNDWMAMELLREDSASGKYLMGSGPQNTAEQRLWGVPVILAKGIPQGTGLIADFTTVGVLKRGDYSLVWTEQGTYQELDAEGEPVVRDLFGTNKVRFRAEARYGILLSQPVAVRKIDLTA